MKGTAWQRCALVFVLFGLGSSLSDPGCDAFHPKESPKCIASPECAGMKKAAAKKACNNAPGCKFNNGAKFCEGPAITPLAEPDGYEDPAPAPPPPPPAAVDPAPGGEPAAPPGNLPPGDVEPTTEDATPDADPDLTSGLNADDFDKQDPFPQLQVGKITFKATDQKIVQWGEHLTQWTGEMDQYWKRLQNQLEAYRKELKQVVHNARKLVIKTPQVIKQEIDALEKTDEEGRMTPLHGVDKMIEEFAKAEKTAKPPDDFTEKLIARFAKDEQGQLDDCLAQHGEYDSPQHPCDPYKDALAKKQAADGGHSLPGAGEDPNNPPDKG